MYVSPRERKARIEDLQKRTSYLKDKLQKEFEESEHPRDNDGKFTSGGGGGSEGESFISSVFNKMIGLHLASTTASATAGLIGFPLMAMGVNPLAVAAVAGISAIYVGAKTYNIVTKAEIPKGKITFKSEADAKKFLDAIPKVLSGPQLAKLNEHLKSKLKDTKGVS